MILVGKYTSNQNNVFVTPVSQFNNRWSLCTVLYLFNQSSKLLQYLCYNDIIQYYYYHHHQRHCKSLPTAVSLSNARSYQLKSFNALASMPYVLYQIHTTWPSNCQSYINAKFWLTSEHYISYGNCIKTMKYATDNFRESYCRRLK